MNSNKVDPNPELVVIGAGGAGLAAGLAAAENGVKNIIILEARPVPGGNAVNAMGMFAAESRVQTSFGVDARKDDLFKKAMSYAHWKTNPRLVRALVDLSGDTIQWLEEHGQRFERIKAVYPNQVPLVSHMTGGPGKTGANVVRSLMKSCEKMGVNFLYKTKATHLITGENGAVTGVLGLDGEKEIRFHTKSVVIATGGFLGNKELLSRFFPSYNQEEFHYSGLPHNGDGLRMATEIGAATEGLAVLEMEGPAFPWSPFLSVISKRPNTIWVNKRGERFTDETVIFLFPESANSLYRQPKRVSYTLFDENIKWNLFKAELTPFEKLVVGEGLWHEKAEKDLRLQAEKGRAKISESLEGIAEWIGANPNILQAEINEYNIACDQGHDAIFAKDRRYLHPLRKPPYYAIQCCLNLLTTHGGIKINHRMEVLDTEDNPIAGLYAAGNETGTTDSDTYDVNLAGHSFGFAINSGRIAGNNAAEFIARP